MTDIDLIIRNLKSIPKRIENKQQFFDEFRKVGLTMTISLYIHPNHYIFRSRINENDISFHSVSDINYPKQPSFEFGRAHSPNCTVFYGSYVPSITLEEEFDLAYVTNAFEISEFLNDSKSVGKLRCTIGKWQIIDELALACIVFEPNLCSNSFLSQSLHGEYLEHLKKFPKMLEHSTVWNAFIGYEFSKDCSGSEYIISALYAEYIMSKGFDGILYPSVKGKGRGLNVALTKEAVDKKLRLVAAGEGVYYKNAEKALMQFEKICTVTGSELNFVLGNYRYPEEKCWNIVR